ncbi:dienelactone hydrolase family protein [Haliea sp. E1-2-M8]|uniref:dienelactone hydrolase family protein n=1 Tax=Haliea sp. E1-2-M8 TaxID=3064706 RepID=UPI00271D5D69|nr:dienelactone hydrolase family protein [Haliea sp. E1-2-M8]MDO8862847.1 dienelactone hydrolase family protein [Haliea sp. E1-2-M8]
MAIQTRKIAYQHAGLDYEGLLAWDDAASEQRPGVAVAHTWAGRSEFEEGKAMELAEHGYVGFALDVFGKGVRGEGTEQCQDLIAPLLADRVLLQDLVTLAVSVMSEQAEVDSTRVAAMGYCFGGLTVLDLARTGADVRGVVSFHGLFNAPDNTAGTQIKAKVLCLHGYDDPMATPENLQQLAQELSTAGADWQVHAYGNTMHAFTNPQANDPGFGAVYSAAADRRSSRALYNFLEEVLV